MSRRSDNGRRAGRFVQDVWRAGLTTLLMLGWSVTAAGAQELAVGAYAPAPVGINLLTMSGSFSLGGVSFDPTLPVEDVSATLGGGFVGYGRTLRMGRRFGSVMFGVPFVKGNLEGLLLGQREERRLAGFGDPVLRVAANLYGAPAMTPAEFAKFRPRTIVGVSLAVTAPLGQYDPNRRINIGRNRWAFKPEVAIANTRGAGRWRETSARRSSLTTGTTLAARRSRPRSGPRRAI